MKQYLVKVNVARQQGQQSWLRTLPVEYRRGGEENTVFYSDLACFMNTVTLNMNIFMSYTRFTRRNTLFILVVAPQEYVTIYSTRRLRTERDKKLRNERSAFKPLAVLGSQ